MIEDCGGDPDDMNIRNPDISTTEYERKGIEGILSHQTLYMPAGLLWAQELPHLQPDYHDEARHQEQHKQQYLPFAPWIKWIVEIGKGIVVGLRNLFDQLPIGRYSHFLTHLEPRGAFHRIGDLAEYVEQGHDPLRVSLQASLLAKQAIALEMDTEIRYFY